MQMKRWVKHTNVTQALIPFHPIMLQTCSLSLTSFLISVVQNTELYAKNGVYLFIWIYVAYQYSSNGIAQGIWSAKEFSTSCFLLCKMGLIPAYFTEVSVRISL